MAEYLVTVRTSSGAEYPILEPESMNMDWSLDDPATVSFSLDGESNVAAHVEELISDIIVRRNGDKLFRGRVGYGQDHFGPERMTINFTASDYREVLGRRILWSSMSWNNIDQARILWDIIEHTQDQTAGNLGITRGDGQLTGMSRVRDFDAGKNIGEALAELAEVENGFEWEIDAELRANVFYPQRGSGKLWVLEYGSNIESGNRTVSPGDFANAIRINGTTDSIGFTPVATLTSTGITSAPEGRWDYQGEVDTKAQATLNDHAAFELNVRAVVRPSYSLVFSPDEWSGPESLWLGDSIRTVVRRGRLNVNTLLRVTEVGINFTDDGEEEVRMSLGYKTPSFHRRFQRIETRLRNLERR